MKFIVSSTYLHKHLQVLGAIIGTSNTIPILENFLFNLDGNNLRITASDMETTISSDIEVESTHQGSLCIPAKLLLDILKTFADQPLTFATTEQNTIEISSSHGKYALAYMSSDDYPKSFELTDSNATELTADVLATAINNTIFATGNDDLRPIMTGVLFELKTDGLTFVATDAHKLVKYTREDYKAEHNAEFIMPKKPLNLLRNILQGSEDNVKIEYNESNAKFTFENTELVCRLIDGKYPNYQAVIPKENPNRLTIERNQLLSSVRRVAIFANKSTPQIRLNIAGAELKIYAEDIDVSNRAEERLSCSYEGDDMQIGFNAKFLIEMLNSLNSKEIQLEMSLPNRAGILTPLDNTDEGEKITMLVMPVMLSN